MQKINYQKVLDETIKNLGAKNRLLLHSCCGPCSSYCLEYLGNYFEITVLYYNPNIYPMEELDLRIEEQKKVIDKVKAKYPIQLIVAEHDPHDFYRAIRGLEVLGENSLRCEKCYALRLREAAEIADRLHCDYFTTTLSISPHKDSQKLNQIGEVISKNYHAQYLFSDFKKKNGFKRSVELTKEFDIYRQEYCGCVFSKKEWEEKQLDNIER